MKNNIFETNDDVRKIYKQEKIKYFKLFRAVMIFIGIVGVVYIGWAMIYLQNWNTEQLEIKVIQAPEHHLAMINGVETVVSVQPDGTKSASINYAYCKPLAFVNNCRWDRENFRVELK